MDKKSFIKGIATTIVVMIAGTILWNIVVVKQLIPWHILPVEIGMPTGAKVKLVESFLEEYYVDDVDYEEVEKVMFQGMLAGVGDPYTYYLDKEALDTSLQKNAGQYVGIGIEVYQESNKDVVIFSVTEGNSAQQAGMLPGDVITKVDGISVEAMELADIIALIQGEVGSSVTVEVYRDAQKENLEFVMERIEIITKTIEWEILEDKKGYIQLLGFKENTYDQFMEALEGLTALEMKGLIIDLRNNPGGLVSSVYKIGEELLPSGVMVSTIDKKGNEDQLVCDEEFLDIPMVVLVNGNSASASEIFAGAAQDKDAAIIVGTQTFGKGLVQRLFMLPDGSALNITIEKYFTPSGASIHGTGVTPDYVVEMPEGHIDGEKIQKEEDIQLQEGLRILKEEIKK